VGRRSLFGALTLLSALFAHPGDAGAQGGAAATNSPAPTPPGLDAVAVPLAPDSPSTGEHPVVGRRIIASSRPGSTPSLGPVPLPDDALAPVPNGAADGGRQPASSTALRTAVYRPDVDAGPVETVANVDVRPPEKTGPKAPAGARMELYVEGPAEIAPGKSFAYVIHVQSVGNAPAAAVRITDHLPPGARLVDAEPKPEIAGDRLAWDLGDLPPGTERRLRVALDAAALTAGLLVSPAVTFGVSPGLRVAPARPGLEIRLAGPDSAPPGSLLPYRVLITNNGMTPLPRILVQVKLTGGLRHPRMPRGDSIEADVTLAAGETKTLPLDLVAGSAGPNLVAATARVDGGTGASAQAAVRVDPGAVSSVPSLRTAPDLRVQISSLSAAVPVGTTAIYEVKVLNPADTPQTGIRLVAEMSEGMEPEQADGPTASALTQHGMTFETLWRLGPGDSAVYHVRARTRRAGVQQLRVEVNADHLAQPASAEANVWVAPGSGH
jgi:uncharacterized repeat protein (TIGR01451 family)